MDELYIQCTLDRKIRHGGQMTVTWLPQEFAKLGTVVSLKDDIDGWTDGWKVTRAGAKTATREEVGKLCRLYLHQREASDI